MPKKKTAAGTMVVVLVRDQLVDTVHTPAGTELTCPEAEGKRLILFQRALEKGTAKCKAWETAFGKQADARAASAAADQASAEESAGDE